MEEKLNSYLETERLGKLMQRYGIPCVISLLVAALYNIVDQIFIANADYLGSYGNAANTVVFPLTVVALALAVVIGDGYCAFVSISLGANQKEQAHRSIGNSVLLSILAGVGLMVIYLIFQEPILTLFGGRVNEQTFSFSREYFFYITLGIPCYIFGQAMNPIIRSDGSPKFAMVSTLAGAVVNLILDPVFLFVFRWGMMGAAVATVLGQILTAALSIWYLCHMKAVRLERKSFGLYGCLMKKFLPLGLTSFLAQISLVISMAAVQNMCTKYGALDPVFGQPEYAQIPLAVLGIVMKFFQIVISISIGHGGWLYPGSGIQYGSRPPGPGQEAVLLSADCRSSGGRCGAGYSGAFSGAVDRDFWREKRECLLYSVRGEELPDLSVYDGTGHGQQRDLYLSAGHRQGGCLCTALVCKRGGVWCGAGDPFAAVLGPGWPAVFLPRGRYPDFPPVGGCDILYPTNPEIWRGAERMKNRIVTISREFGSGGRTVGKKLAQKLQIPCYDQEIIEKIAAESGFAEDYIRDRSEYSPHTSWIANAFSERSFSGVNNQDAIWMLQRKIILDLAAQGPCVIVGRCADYILRNVADCLRVFIHADFDKRAERIVEVYGETDVPTEKRLRDKDKRRAAYYQFYTDTKWGLAQNYHISLDSGTIGIDRCVELLADLY